MHKKINKKRYKKNIKKSIRKSIVKSIKYPGLPTPQQLVFLAILQSLLVYWPVAR